MLKKKTEKISKKITQEEYEKQVLELARKGLTCEKIGEKLRRDGIHPKEYSKTISKILKEKKMYVNSDIKNVSDKLERVKAHYQKNKQDKRTKREIERISAKLRKLKAYFKEN